MSATLEPADVSQRQRLVVQFVALDRPLETEPKPPSWGMRAKLDERVKWYRDVD